MFLANILLFVNIAVSVLLVIIILLQRASGGLGALGGGGSGAAFSGASTGNALTKATTILAIIFMVSSLLLAIELGGKGRESSVVDETASEIVVDKEAVDPADTTPVMPMTLPSSPEGENSVQ